MAYPGGKSQAGTYQKIINQMPPHDRYFELFAGMGGVLIAKRPARVSLAVEVDPVVAAALAEKVDGSCVPGVTVVNGDAISFLQSYAFAPTDLVYLDPPYLFESRKGGRRSLYTAEFGDTDQHEQLLGLLLGLPCMVAISGYWSSLYAARLATWRAVSWRVQTRGRSWAVEWLWMNYREPQALHDYRYLGNDYREREKLARRRRRWSARLERMPALERYMLLSALDDWASKPATSGGTAGFPEAPS